jgi:AraC-like DNA-binding protein
MAQNAGPFHSIKPRDPLGDFVDFFWTYEGYLPPHKRERLLPTGTMELVFRLDADGRASSGVAGPRSVFSEFETPESFSIVGVHFKPGGGFPFFGVPSSDLHNQGVPLDAVWTGCGAEVSDRLWEAEAWEERFDVLESALLRRVQGQSSRHPAVRYALGVFDRSNGTCPVNDVLKPIGISQRRFIDVFRAEVGLSPKVFCRIRRFDEALRRIETMAEVDWLDVALSCGYFDQAHFNHDFHSFAGINPSTYLRRRTSRTHVALVD